MSIQILWYNIKLDLAKFHVTNCSHQLLYCQCPIQPIGAPRP